MAQGQFVDRGSILQGINKTLRDSRLPTEALRSMVNYSTPDGRARRRPGRAVYSKQFRGSQLTKHTPFGVFAERTAVDGKANQLASSPMSYGLLKWHDDFQPKSTRDWTTEFLFTVGEAEPILYRSRIRKSKHAIGASTRALRTAERDGTTMGGVVFDQSVTANHFGHYDNSLRPNPTSAVYESDTFSLSALTVSYSATEIKVSFDTYLTVNYVPTIIKSVDYGYEPGRSYHIAIRYTQSTRTVEVFLDGDPIGLKVLQATEVFAGEEDHVNGADYTLKRDIVLLNEFTVRGGMASTCRVVDDASHFTDAHEALFSYDEFDSEDVPFEPPTLCHSPPSGTGISELRFWHSARTQSEIQQNARIRLTETDENLKGYWRLDDGGPVCVETQLDGTAESARVVTLHHGNPGYVADSGLAGGFGLVLADGQHLRKEYVTEGGVARLDLEDSYVQIDQCLDNHEVIREYSGQHDFTVVMEIRTPHDFGKEQNYRTTDTELEDAWAAAGTGTAAQSESGRRYHDHQPFGLTDGDGLNTARSSAERFILDAVGGAIGQGLSHRAFDQTLWSVEAEFIPFSGSHSTTVETYARVPVARGMLTPDGRVAFEFFGRGVGGTVATSREFRLLSQTTLQPNTVYRIGFRKRTITKLNTTDDVYYGVGYKLEIFLDGPGVTIPTTGAISDNQIGIGGRDNGDPVDIPTASTGSSILNSGTMYRGPIREVIIGSSYVADSTDRSFRVQSGTDPVFSLLNSRYLSPTQDQPGFFTLGSFRMWTASLDDQEVRSVMGGGPASKQNLLYNIEIDKPGTDKVVSRAESNTIFTAGFKGWGEISSYQEDSEIHEQGEITTGFFLEDRIGWGPLPIDFLNTREAACGGLLPFSSTLERRYGVVAVFDGAVYHDESLTGRFDFTKSVSRGLLDDFTTGGRWRGTSIGDRAVLTSRSGKPKVWNGKNITTLGFPEWSGGNYSAVGKNGSGATTTIQPDKWYGLRVVYRAESQAIVAISPQFAVQTLSSGSNHFIEIPRISPHPDPRVTSIVVYMTKGADGSVTDRDSAMTSVALFPNESILPNTYLGEWHLFKDPSGAVLDLTRTTFPSCAFSASAFNRLYLAGDAQVPDIIYFSDLGNPESISTLDNRIVLEEGSGDEIVDLRAAFGALFAFKPGSIWRVTDTGQFSGNTAIHDVQRLANIGPTSSDAIAMVTLPENGRVAFIFWSKHGPYFFDGVNVQPIGYPIEGERAYEDVTEGSVIIVHDVEHRELAFVYKSRSGCCGGGCDSEYRDKALVYNYRTQNWHEETGVLGSVALSSDLTLDISARSEQSGTGVGPAVVRTETRYLPLVGTENGRVLLWGQGQLDGIEDGVVQTLGKVTSWDSSAYRLEIEQDESDHNGDGVTESEPWDDAIFRGIWVTIEKSDRSARWLVMIKDNGDAWLDLENRGCDPPITPEAGDRIYVGRPAAEIEFPWDVLDQPFYEKRLLNMHLWGRGDLLWRRSFGWSLQNSGPWNFSEGIQDNAEPGLGNRKRRISVNGRSESFKLWLASMDLDSELDAYGYEVEATAGAEMPQ